MVSSLAVSTYIFLVILKRQILKKWGNKQFVGDRSIFFQITSLTFCILLGKWEKDAAIYHDVQIHLEYVHNYNKLESQYLEWLDSSAQPEMS